MTTAAEAQLAQFRWYSVTDPLRVGMAMTHYGPALERLVAVEAERDRLRAQLDAVRELHTDTYTYPDGRTYQNQVWVPCSDSACACDSDGDGHEVPACTECRTATDEMVTGYLLYPCPTVRAALGDPGVPG